MDFDSIIEKISKKYNYSKELTDALKMCVPAMAEGKSKPEVQLIIDTLERVEIFEFEKKPTQGQLDEIESKKIAGRNTHITKVDLDQGEYGKEVSSGAYISTPVFDEKMRIIDRCGYLYTTKLSETSMTAKFQGTRINLSHLIHELGHAIAAQKDEYVQEENGDYYQNVGACRVKNVVDSERCIAKETEQTGLYVEEALNSLEEERVLCKVLGVASVDEIPGYVPSKYQQSLTDMMQSYVDMIGSLPFSKMRILKNYEDLDKYMEIIEQSQRAKEMKTKEYYDEKVAIFDQIYDMDLKDETGDARKKLREFFEKYREIFFNPDLRGNFLDRLDNVFNQEYNFESIGASFKIGEYDFEIGEWVKNEKNNEVFNSIQITILKECYVPLNQAEEQILAYKSKCEQVSVQSLVGQALECQPAREEMKSCVIRNAPEQTQENVKEVE